MAKKSLGQNFLLNMDTVRKIARSAGNLNGITVIEVGPGPGGLTRALLEAGAEKIIAIEHDPRCVLALQDLIAEANGNLEVIQADALTISPQDLVQGPIKIVANLPYNVGTPLLIKWLHKLSNIQSMTLMFQKEVALRIVAKTRTADYGRLSVLCQYLTTVSKVFDLPPGAFSPPPKVTSSVVHLIPKSLSAENLSLTPHIERLTHAAFGQRRKMIRSSLSSVLTQEQILENNIPVTARAEELTLDQYSRLAKTIQKLFFEL
ncbi:16S rRNA (adenine(1518)-N(6)/adenine(1519)-N(6))-dimethyltransferase RsmA [Candidatus Paracaedibacter acanthamoebae]